MNELGDLFVEQPSECRHEGTSGSTRHAASEQSLWAPLSQGVSDGGEESGVLLWIDLHSRLDDVSRLGDQGGQHASHHATGEVVDWCQVLSLESIPGKLF